MNAISRSQTDNPRSECPDPADIKAICSESSEKVTSYLSENCGDHEDAATKYFKEVCKDAGESMCKFWTTQLPRHR